MPFTGTGTGIQNANDVFFSGLAQGNVLRYNNSTAKWNNATFSVTTADVVNDAITEPKLAVSNSPVSDYVLSWNGSAMAWAAQSATTPDATTTTKGGVQLAGDLSGTAAAPTVPGLATKANASHTHAQSDVTGLVAALAGKEATLSAGTTTQYYRGDKTWQTLDKMAVGLSNIDNTSDANKPVSTAVSTALGGKIDKSTATTKGDVLVATAAATVTRLGVGSDGQILTADSAQASGVKWAAPAAQTPADATTGSKGIVQLAGDLAGTATAPTVATGAITATKVASDAITEPKLAMTNSPSTGQVISWNGTTMAWAGALAFAFTRIDVSSATYTVPNSFIYVFADATAQGITITLPAPANNAYVRVKRMNGGANGVQVVAPAGSYIDASGAGSDVLNNQYDSQEYWSDGSNWYR